MEVLACAESAEAVIAAVQSGADAIYIRFGGRGVRGFTEDALMKSVRYCRVRVVWALVLRGCVYPAVRSCSGP